MCGESGTRGKCVVDGSRCGAVVVCVKWYSGWMDGLDVSMCGVGWSVGLVNQVFGIRMVFNFLESCSSGWLIVGC